MGHKVDDEHLNFWRMAGHVIYDLHFRNPPAWTIISTPRCRRACLDHFFCLTIRTATMTANRPSNVLPNAMPWPIFEKLRDKRVVLASSSPRRKDILENVVSDLWLALPAQSLMCRASVLRSLLPRLMRSFPRECLKNVWPTIPSPPLGRRWVVWG